MEIRKDLIKSEGIRFNITKDGSEVARARLYLLYNDLHDRPFGFLEDVFVDEKYRQQGIGTKIVKQIVDEAKARGCYKLIATSRYSSDKVHEFYKRLGFNDHGKEFRINF